MEETSLLNLNPLHALQVLEAGHCVQVLLYHQPPLVNTEQLSRFFTKGFWKWCNVVFFFASLFFENDQSVNSTLDLIILQPIHDMTDST